MSQRSDDTENEHNDAKSGRKKPKFEKYIVAGTKVYDEGEDDAKARKKEHKKHKQKKEQKTYYIEKSEIEEENYYKPPQKTYYIEKCNYLSRQILL